MLRIQEIFMDFFSYYTAPIAPSIHNSMTFIILFVDSDAENVNFIQKLKVKSSLYRPWRPLGFREVEAPTFSDIQLIDGGKVVSPTRRPLSTPPPGKFLVLLCVRG
jgi:hypothetical protein